MVRIEMIVYKQSFTQFDFKMNFHILFEAIAALSFSIRYDVSDEKYQDLFLFQGNDSQAHLYRQNDVLKLYLKYGDVFSSYRFENVSSSFLFSWPDFSVNGREMYPVHQGVLDVKYFDFNEFTFISPILGLQDHVSFEQPLLQNLNELKNVNYGYILLIMIVLVFVLKVDARAVKGLVNAIKVIMKLEKDYVSMKSVEIDKSNIAQDHEQKL